MVIYSGSIGGIRNFGEGVNIDVGDGDLVGLGAIRSYGGHSSVGRASDCGSECRGFDPHWPPHLSLLWMQRCRALLRASRSSQKTHYLFAKISFPECRLLALHFHDSPDNFTKFHELDANEMLVHLQC
jgi:hypothetical protein